MAKTQNKYLPLAAGAAIQLCIGIIYLWSVFRGSVIDYYSAHVTADFAASCASLTYSIMLATFVLGIVAGGRVNDKKGPRPVVLAGGLLFAAGILLSAVCVMFAPQYPWLLCVFYGGVAGFGVGAAYTSTISCAQKWFLDRKGFATGVIVCTFGASTVVFTPVANALLSYGVAQTFLTMALIFLAVILIFVWFVKNPSAEYLQKFAASPQLTGKKQYSPTETLRAKSYYVVLICMVLLTASYFIVNPLFKSLGAERGLSENAILGGIMATGVASAAGRLAAPWLSDRIGRRNVLVVLYGITIAAALCLVFARGYFYNALISLAAFAFGGSAGVFPAISADYFGTKNAGVNYGLVMIGFAVSALVFPNVTSAINAGLAQASPLTFVIPAAACVVGIALSFMMKPPKEKAGAVARS